MARNYHSDIYEKCEPIIRDKVNEWEREQKKFANPTQIVKELKNVLEEHTNSETTIRRILAKMNFYFLSPKSYGFDSGRVYFNEVVTYLGYRKHICFLVKDISMGNLIVNKLNEYYSSFAIGLGDYVHCAVVNDLLICFYNESEEKEIDQERLSYEILQLLSQLFYGIED